MCTQAYVKFTSSDQYESFRFLKHTVRGTEFWGAGNGGCQYSKEGSLSPSKKEGFHFFADESANIWMDHSYSLCRRNAFRFRAVFR